MDDFVVAPMIEKPKDIFERIEQSPLLTQFTAAFEAATGLPLELHEPESTRLAQTSAVANPFCRILNEHNRCPDCVAAAHCVGREISSEPKAQRCFAGLQESFVPIFAGQVVVGYLTTGQIFIKGQIEVEWQTVATRLGELGYGKAGIARLETAWRRTRTLNGDSYAGAVTLMAVFAGQLSDLADRILLEQSQSEPPAIIKARQYVSAHLSETIDLNQVAVHVGMSPFHFCRVFKSATGLTFKQYLTRRRVEWAKCRLRKPGSRATEVAFEVGFGSLSQFNRSFQQVVGSSPSDWRTTEARKLAAAV